MLVILERWDRRITNELQNEIQSQRKNHGLQMYLTQVVECLLRMYKALGSTPRTSYIGFTTIPALTQEVEAVGAGVWFGLLREFEASLRHMRPCHRQTPNKKWL